MFQTYHTLQLRVCMQEMFKVFNFQKGNDFDQFSLENIANEHNFPDVPVYLKMNQFSLGMLLKNEVYFFFAKLISIFILFFFFFKKMIMCSVILKRDE